MAVREHGQIYLNRGIAHFYVPDHDRAIADFTEAVRLNPALAHAWNNRGLAWQRKREFAKAVADHSAEIALVSNNPNFLRHRAHAYEALDDMVMARVDYDEAARIAPRDRFARSERARFLRRQGDYAAAVARSAWR